MDTNNNAVENQELIEKLKSFVTRASRESADWSHGEKAQNWWAGRVDAYQHILCLLNPNYFGDAQTTQTFLDEVWSIPGDLLEDEDEDIGEEELETYEEFGL